MDMSWPWMLSGRITLSLFTLHFETWRNGFRQKLVSLPTRSDVRNLISQHAEPPATPPASSQHVVEPLFHPSIKKNPYTRPSPDEHSFDSGYSTMVSTPESSSPQSTNVSRSVSGR